MKSTEEKSDKRLEVLLVCLFKQKKVLVCAEPEGNNNKKISTKLVVHVQDRLDNL